ncbi:thiamine phosphate synthase [Saccharicrinis aurantiacus]|uniref:thiamine phosphate synthase n=1 Tax=Saccharicrinis aurantiacus TaxID=1849719 RepID=UPI0024911635|nr:thiamine phosphate synthase [Saccharicrinis aurantiacus]
MNKPISKLQFITLQDGTKTPEQQTVEYCAGGGSWVQLRLKDLSEEEITAEAVKCLKVCINSEATFIVNDHVHIAEKIDADGVHLGKNDISVSEARAILGPVKIIGATANTFEDVKRLSEEGADYIGLGPYKFTTTKKNLSATLGSEGYQSIIEQCKAANITTPIIAIGGITPDDLPEVFATGIHGVALSSYIAEHNNIGLETLELLKQIGKLHSLNFRK